MMGASVIKELKNPTYSTVLESRNGSDPILICNPQKVEILNKIGEGRVWDMLRKC